MLPWILDKAFKGGAIAVARKQAPKAVERKQVLLPGRKPEELVLTFAGNIVGPFQQSRNSFPTLGTLTRRR